MFNFTMDLIYLLALICIGLSIMTFCFFVERVAPEVPESDRTHMDPLPSGLKLIWPLVLLASLLAEILYSNANLDKIEKQLQKTGVSYVMRAEEFIGLRIVSAVICFCVSLFLIAALKPQQGTMMILIFATVGGFFFPLVWLSDTRKRREQQVIRSLPVYLDFTTMAVQAGLNLSGALQQALNKGPDGPLRNELSIVMRDIRSGITRAEALKRMSDRLDIDDVTRFVNAVVQAEKMGSSMATAMKIQAEQRRTERFQRAEKKAMEAPVKLIFPLVVFIFPVTFMVLGFPIVVKFLDL